MKGTEQDRRLPHDEAQTQQVERSIKRVFFGACVLSLLLLVLLVSRVAPWHALERSHFLLYVSLLVWAFAVICYSFYSLMQLTRKVHRNLAEKSYTDQLTGLRNFRYLQEQLNDEVQRVQRYGGQLGVLFLDLDKFKQVNDSYGHNVGNRVLRKTAQCIAEQIRAVDVIGRVGGDEFVILLPETGREEARRLGQRLCRAVHEHSVSVGNDEKVDFVHMSVGVAVFPDNGDTAAAVVTAADRAVYQAKEEEGCAVCVSEEFISGETGILSSGLPEKVEKRGQRTMDTPTEED